MIRRALIGIAMVSLLVIAGCTSSNTTGASVVVTATNSTCEVADTSLEPGSTTFRVSNKGNDVTEVYVYAEGDKVVGEVENIGPGTSRDLVVELTGGTFELACKPGQKGDGIRTTVQVTGDAVAAEPADRSVSFDAMNAGYTGLGAFTAVAGERIEFVMTNDDAVDAHEFELFAPDGATIGEIPPVVPGATADAAFTLAEAGTYTYVCGIEGHEQRGMKGTFEVGSA